MNIWFTSDTHFNHQRIIELSDRPFQTLEEMNRELILRWNALVTPDDTIYHLGDFALGRTAEWPIVCQQLNGYKVLTLGNHDGTRTKMLQTGFSVVEREVYIELGCATIWMAHVPPRVRRLFGARSSPPRSTLAIRCSSLWPRP